MPDVAPAPGVGCFPDFAIVWNLLAHGWTLLVFFGTGKVLGNAVIIGESDAWVMIGLDAIGTVLLLVLIGVLASRKRASGSSATPVA